MAKQMTRWQQRQHRRNRHLARAGGFMQPPTRAEVAQQAAALVAALVAAMAKRGAK